MKPYGHNASFLLGLPIGVAAYIDPKRQKHLLTIARRMNINLTTAKTQDGLVVILKMKTRPIHRCPSCGYCRKD